MNRLYKEYKNRVVKQDGVYGNVCGWCDAHILLALDKPTDACFSLDELGKKDYFIEDRFLDAGQLYCYADESQIIKYQNDVKHKTKLLPT